MVCWAPTLSVVLANLDRFPCPDFVQYSQNLMCGTFFSQVVLVIHPLNTKKDILFLVPS